MKKILKYSALVIVIFLIVIVATPFIFKGKLIELSKQEINKQLNAKIEFGEFDLSIISSFPNLLFEINDVKVIGKNKFANDTLFNMQKFSAEVDLMSVMSDNIKIKSIIIDKPIINAIVLPDSSANWDITIESDKGTDDEAVEEVVEETSDDGAFNLALNLFAINNAIITYKDYPGNMSANINDLSFELNGDLSAEKTILKIKTLIKELSFEQDGVKMLNKTEMAYDADIEADLENFKFTFNKNLFRINTLELAFEGFVAMPDNDINMDIKFATNNTNFKSLLSLVPVIYMTDFENVKTAGNLKLDGFAKGTYNNTSLPAFELNLLVNNAMFKYPDVPAAVNNIAIDLNIANPDGIDDHTIVDLKKFHIEMAQNPFDIRVLTKTPISDPYIDGNFTGTIDFNKMKDIIPLDSMQMSGILTSNLSFKGNLSTIEEEHYEDFYAQGKIGLENFLYKDADFPDGVLISETELEFSPQYVALNSFKTQIGKSDISANGRIDNLLSYYFKDDLLKGVFNVNSNNLDLNEFMSDEENTETAENTTDTTSSSEEALEIIEIPKNIDFELNTNFKKVLYDKLNITDIIGKMTIKEGVAAMDNLKMNMLDGSMNLNGFYSTKDITKPNVDFNMDISEFDIHKAYNAFDMIQETAPIAKNCSGKFSMIFGFNSLLNDSLSPIMNTVNGKGHFSSNKITIDNSDIFNKLAGLLKSDKYKTMELSNVNVNFTIVDGNIEVEPFTTKSGNSEFSFGGKQGIDQSLAYNMDMKIPSKDLGAQANAVMNNLSALAGANGVDVKVPEFIDIKGLITGTIDKPVIKLDLANQANNAADNIKEQVIDKLNKEVDKAKGKGIAEAQKQADKIIAEADKRATQIEQTAQQTANKIRSNGKTTAKSIRDEAKKQGDKLIKEAGNNPFKKKAAELSADKLIKEADKKANATEDEANKKAKQAEDKGKKEADNIRKTAKDKADAIIKKAKDQ